MKLTLEKDTPFYLKGYNVYRNDRTKKSGGGVLLAVKENIISQLVYNQIINNNESIAVEITTKSYGKILVGSLYVPPTVKINPEVIQDLYRINSDCIIMGDLNAALQTMGSRKTNTRGRQLQDIINEGYIYCIDDYQYNIRTWSV